MKSIGFILQGIFTGILTVILLVVAGGFFVWYGYHQLVSAVEPDIKYLLNKNFPESSKIYDKDGELLYELSREIKSTPVPLTEIADSLQKAVVVIEDKDFFVHQGVSLPSIVRSGLMNFVLGEPAYGGSTITQQVVKLTILPKDKTLARKISEAIWAREIEQHLSKQAILEIYLNQLPFGGNLYGVEAAARSYFGKSAKQLSLAESAYLASIPNAPSFLNPFGENRLQLEDRKNKVLALLYTHGYITQADYNLAKSQTVKFLSPQASIFAPHFVFYITQELIKEYGAERVYNGGLKVYTSLDRQLQSLGEQVVKSQLASLTPKYKNFNAGLVALDPKSGRILAMVGSKDYFAPSEPAKCVSGQNCRFDPFTNVTTAPLQPGSSFKPYIYATAFDRGNGYYPGSVVLDVVKNFSPPGAVPYVPKNYNYFQYGRVSLRKALAGSLNIATVRLASELGLDTTVAGVKKFGFEGDFRACGLAMALGACEVTLLEHTAGIAGLANLGKLYQAHGIVKVLDARNNVISELFQPATQVVDEQSAYEVISILKDSQARKYIFGNNPNLVLKQREVMVKTGTTQNWKDGWTVGATPSLAVGVWTGNNNGQVMAKGADGAFSAAPIWHQFMESALQDTYKEVFVRPSGIAEYKINPYTGKLAGSGQRTQVEIASDYTELSAPNLTLTGQVEPVGPAITYEFSPVKFMGITSGEVWKTEGLKIIAVQAEENFGTRASLYVDGNLYSSIQGPNFYWQLPSDLLTPGEHLLKVLAVNQAGYRSEDTVKITVATN
jgi:membrane peptidoglycan carboxypeptidase